MVRWTSIEFSKSCAAVVYGSIGGDLAKEKVDANRLERAIWITVDVPDASAHRRSHQFHADRKIVVLVHKTFHMSELLASEHLQRVDTSSPTSSRTATHWTESSEPVAHLQD